MRKAFFQLHIAVFLAGFTGILGDLIKLNEGLLVWYRLLFTAATMWLLFSWQKLIKRISVADILRIAGVGILAAMHWVLFYASIKYANVSVGLVCLSASGLFTAVLEPVIERKRIRKNEIMLGMITMIGIAIIFHFDTRYKVGIAIGLVSTFFASLFPIFNRRYLKRINVETLLCWQQTGGFVFLS
ncbi:MAG: EamA family transporter, partial [Flavitalea sp.]